MSTPPTLRKNPRAILALIIILAVLLRLAVALYLGDTTPPAKDETSYSVLAARLVSGHGYSFPTAWYPFSPANAPTSHWSFLYTAYAAAIYTLFGVHPLAVRLLTALLGGILLPLAVYFLARRAFPPPLTINPSQFTIHHSLPLLAAALAALYAYFILYGAMLMTETLFIICVVWSLERALALAQRIRSGFRLRLRDGVWLGVALGLATLFRQSILPWAGVVFLWLLWVDLRTACPEFSEGFKRLNLQIVLPLLAAGLTMLAFILPFTIRNYVVYGDFLLLNSNAGYAMYSAQHPLHGTGFQAYAAAPLPTDLHPLGQRI
ncbi:MAG: hypothetical protein GY764_08995 [Halieaceae bacterium]|nr:hypothetical protein [Halieaceae bacterium]